MINIVVVFPKIEDAKSIKNLLVRNGMNVTAVCTSGAQTMNMVDNFDYTVVICGYKLNDMLYSELYECLPPTCQMLLVASRAKLQDVIYPEILSVAMPLKVNDLVNTIDMMMQTLERKKRKQRSKPKHRTPEEQAILACLKSTPCPVDEVIAATGLPAQRVLSLLTMLTLKGAVQNHPGKCVSIK